MGNPSEVAGTVAMPGRPLRRDAARNHAAVLEAARVLFAERGLAVGFDEIARRAGVGVGTVYRRFPDRDALLAALLEDRLAATDSLAREVLQMDDAWAGLERFVVESVAMFAEDRGLQEATFGSMGRDPRVADRRRRLASLVERVTDRAHEAGVLRPDCGAEDIATIIAMVSSVRVPSGPGITWGGERSAARCLAFALDGIRLGASRALS